MIRVLFFASLRERLGADELSLEADRAATVGELRSSLIADRPDWADELERPDLLMAVNQTLAKSATVVSEGDEVAFFPPVTGG